MNNSLISNAVAMTDAQISCRSFKACRSCYGVSGSVMRSSLGRRGSSSSASIMRRLGRWSARRARAIPRDNGEGLHYLIAPAPLRMREIYQFEKGNGWEPYVLMDVSVLLRMSAKRALALMGHCRYRTMDAHFIGHIAGLDLDRGVLPKGMVIL
jgi:hypothetical protein